MVLHVNITFVHGLTFPICITASLGVYTGIFLADGRGGLRVKLVSVSLISLLSDAEGAIALCTDIIRSLKGQI